MIEIIKNTPGVFEVSNGFIGLKFYKKGEFRGKFEIRSQKEETEECIVKDCYSVINFYSHNKEDLIEITSNHFSFRSQTEKIKNSFGRGLKIIFKSLYDSTKGISYNIQFSLYEKTDFILLRIINIKDNSQEQLSVHSISPLTVKNNALWLSNTNKPTKLDNISWFKQGWQSWSPCKLIFGHEKDGEGSKIDVFKRTFDNQDYKIRGRFYSEYCTVITDLESNNSLILGFTTLNTQFTRILLDYDKNDIMKILSAFGCMDGVLFKNSTINFSEELFICFRSEKLAYYGLIDYAKLVKKRNKVNLNEIIPIGWCSWYYYFTNISQEDIIENLEFFKDSRAIEIDFFQLDDGYFTYIGDFNKPNSKFSDGLKSLFGKINESGFKSGIWTAPFFAEKKSNLFKQHREWFLKDKTTKKLLKVHYGGSWNVFLYGLDLSNTQVLEYLDNFYRNLVYANELNQPLDEFIIKFFKIDFLHAATPIEGDFTNQDLTRAQILYNGVKTIRQAIGDRSFLLGCGAPLGPCIGLVDAMRIGEDTDPKWEEKDKKLIDHDIITPSLKVSLINILYRSFMHRYFWINDPDCLMIRRNETKLTLEEIKLQLTIMGLSGGQILISDDMKKLSEEEINDSKLLIPPYNPKLFHPIVVNAFISELPSIYMLETEEIIGKRYLVSIINWNDNSTSKMISISELIPNLSENDNDFYVYDFWNEKFLGEFKSTDVIELGEIKPHSCNYLNIIPVSENLKKIPILLSTSLHITQGCCEIKHFELNKESNQLNISLKIKGVRKGFLLLKLPENKKIIKSDFEYFNINIEENLWKIFVRFKDFLSLLINLN